MENKMNLYIDFDGVILDTIPLLDRILLERNIDLKDEYKKREVYASLDWEKIVNETPQINDSINIAILTHVNSMQEAIAKINYLEKELPDITKIIVPKEISKAKMLETKNAILVDDYGVNLDEWSKEGGISIKFSTKVDKVYKYKSISKLDQLLDLF